MRDKIIINTTFNLIISILSAKSLNTNLDMHSLLRFFCCCLWAKRDSKIQCKKNNENIWLYVFKFRLHRRCNKKIHECFISTERNGQIGVHAFVYLSLSHCVSINYYMIVKFTFTLMQFNAISWNYVWWLGECMRIWCHF